MTPQQLPAVPLSTKLLHILSLDLASWFVLVCLGLHQGQRHLRPLVR